MDKTQLIEALNADLAGELQAILMYIQYSAKVKGPFRNELRAMFQAEIADEQLHAQYLADKIVVLGGNPTTTPRPVPNADTPEQMLRNILEAENTAINDYNERVGMADEFGDTELRVQMENQVADETKHRDQVVLLLEGWPIRG